VALWRHRPELNFTGGATAALPEFDFDSERREHDGPAERGRRNRSDMAVELPFASLRPTAQAATLGTLALAALTAALVDKLKAAGSDPFLQTDPITFNDLQHGALLIGPRGGPARNIVLDNPEITIVVGPPAAGYPVQQVINSAADMAALLSFSEAVNAIYLLGLADPLVTGTTQRAETHLFSPDAPLITRTASVAPGLPPLLPDQPPNLGSTPPSGGFSSFPGEQPAILTLNFTIDPARVLSHDDTTGAQDGVPDNQPGQNTNSDDTTDPFPIQLAGIFGFDPNSVIGRARDGTPADPFVNTAASVFGAGSIVVTLEASASGADSGLLVTGGGPIFLFTETTNGGEQVVVGREGQNDAPDADGAIAFIVYVTENGESLWVQQSLPIDHGDDQNDFDSMLSIVDAALRLRVTLTDGSTTITQTQPVGHHVAFEDDGPTGADDSAEVQAQTVSFDVNALIILDKSGSMGLASMPNSRISLAKAAILDFAEQPNVLSVRILAFDDSADPPSVNWFDVTTAAGRAALAQFLRPISGLGGTNYQDAIGDAQTTWMPPPTVADLTNVYFISDGAPSASLTDLQRQAWETFLDGQDIDNAYAVGIGTSLSNVELQKIAYPNVPAETNNVIIINSADGLRETLAATTLAGTVSGNVLSNDDFGSDGQGFVRTLSYDSNGAEEGGETTYRFDGADIYLDDILFDDDANEITFDTPSGGTFTFNFETGAWDYTTPDAFGAPFAEQFGYTIADGDGDATAGWLLNIAVSPPASDPIGALLASAQNMPID
jgi:hypothetical protein